MTGRRPVGKEAVMRMGLLCAALLMAAPGAWAAPGDGLDGSNWKMREKTAKAAFLFWTYDHLTFKEGKFISIDARIKGFAPAPYTATKTPGGVSWTAVLSGPDGAAMNWRGTRQGDRLTGEYTLSQGGKSKTVSWGAKQVAHEHPEHPSEKPSKKPAEHPEHPWQPKKGAEGSQAPAAPAPAAAREHPEHPTAPAAAPTQTQSAPAPKAAEHPREHPAGAEHPKGQEHPR